MNVCTLTGLLCSSTPPGVQVGRQGQPGNFTLVCRDSAGQPLGRGGENVLVSIINKDKKNWYDSRTLTPFDCTLVH